MLRVGLTGGIGSGKTTVAKVMEALGAAVYSADRRANELTSSDPDIVAGLTELLGPEVYNNGGLDRAAVAARVFGERELLEGMNRIVHPRVAEDWKRWVADMAAAPGETATRPVPDYAVMEAAILFESGFEGLVDYVVTVEAPVGERVARAAARDGADPAAVRARVANQMSDRERAARADFVIYNGEGDRVLPQILKLHEFFRSIGSSDEYR